VQLRDVSGQVVPSQIIKSEKDHEGNLIVADVAFLAGNTPSVGYETYYLDFPVQAALPVPTDLRIDEPGLAMENEHVRVKVSPQHGAIISLIDRKSGLEMLDGEKSGFPVFKGKPNPDYPLRSAFLVGKYKPEELVIPPEFDSSKSKVERSGAGNQTSAGMVDSRVKSKSDLQWIEKGPLRATIRTRHNWPLLKFEIYVTLHACSPLVEVVTRVLAEIPPALDALTPTRQFPIRIKEGYWLRFASAFEVTSIVRDYPLGVEATTREALHALTFMDLVGRDRGLLVLHAGTQYFTRDASGVFSNLLMREWESFFTGEYGWPRYSEYRHALMPHGVSLTNAERLRSSAEFTRGLLTVVAEPQQGEMPRRKGFVSVSPENLQLSAFRKKPGGQFELRVVEVEGQNATAKVELAMPVAQAAETNFLGQTSGDVSRRGSALSFRIQPWKIGTIEVT
jgi:hypothetical protein